MLVRISHPISIFRRGGSTVGAVGVPMKNTSSYDSWPKIGLPWQTYWYMLVAPIPVDYVPVIPHLWRRPISFPNANNTCPGETLTHHTLACIANVVYVQLLYHISSIGKIICLRMESSRQPKNRYKTLLASQFQASTTQSFLQKSTGAVSATNHQCWSQDSAMASWSTKPWWTPLMLDKQTYRQWKNEVSLKVGFIMFYPHYSLMNQVIAINFSP